MSGIDEVREPEFHCPKCGTDNDFWYLTAKQDGCFGTYGMLSTLNRVQELGVKRLVAVNERIKWSPIPLFFFQPSRSRFRNWANYIVECPTCKKRYGMRSLVHRAVTERILEYIEPEEFEVKTIGLDWV